MESTADPYHDAAVACDEARPPINAALDGLDGSINHLAVTLGDLQQRLALVLRGANPPEPSAIVVVGAEHKSDLMVTLLMMSAKVDSLASTTVAVITRLDL